MIIRKSKQERLLEMIDQLVSNTEITQVSPGSIARSFLDIINEEFEYQYTYLETYMPMAFLSTATGDYVDLIGALLNCKREDGESDDSYKYRISNQVYSAAGANETAIYLACLGVDGVRDVYIVPYAYGIGSFAVYVVTDSSYVSDDVLSNVQSVIDETKALGVTGVAERPTVRRLDLYYKLYLDSSATTSDIAKITAVVSKQIKYNIDNIAIGQTIYIDKIINGILNISDKIVNISISSVNIDNMTVYNKSIPLSASEKVYAGIISSV